MERDSKEALRILDMLFHEVGKVSLTTSFNVSYSLCRKYYGRLSLYVLFHIIKAEGLRRLPELESYAPISFSCPPGRECGIDIIPHSRL